MAGGQAVLWMEVHSRAEEDPPGAGIQRRSTYQARALRSCISLEERAFFFFQLGCPEGAPFSNFLQSALSAIILGAGPQQRRGRVGPGKAAMEARVRHTGLEAPFGGPLS